MSFRRFRRSPLEPAVAGRPFNDSDESPTRVEQWGEPRFIGSSGTLPPRVVWDEPVGWGMGRTSPMDAFDVGPDQVRKISPGRGSLPSAPASHRPLAPWQAFRVLRMDPRLRVCVNRKRRREVLHALGVAGRRGLRGRGGSYSRRPSSSYSCR